MSKKRTNPISDSDKVLCQQTEDKRYKRYRNTQYCYLAVKALAAFVLGILVMYILKLC